MRAGRRLVLILSLLKSIGVIYQHEANEGANKYNGGRVLSLLGDKALVVHPPVSQLVKSKTSPSLEKTQPEHRLTFPETEYKVNVKIKPTEMTTE